MNNGTRYTKWLVVVLCFSGLMLLGFYQGVGLTSGQTSETILTTTKTVHNYALSFGDSVALIPSPTAVDMLLTIDLDNDGQDDVAYVNSSDIYIAQNTTGLEESWPLTLAIGSANQEIAVLVGDDINRNGRVDLVTAAGTEVQLWGNPVDTFSNTWTTGATLAVTTDVTQSVIAISDLDRDGTSDIVAGDAEGIVRLWKNPLGLQGDLTTQWGTVKELPALSGEILDLVVRDLDLDGKSDLIIISDEVSPTLSIWRNPGPAFSVDWTVRVDFLPAVVLILPNASQLVVDDIDGDNWPDIVVGDVNGGMQGWSNPGITPFAGPWGTLFNIESVGGELQDLISADLNNDAMPELVGLVQDFSTDIVAWEHQIVISGATEVMSWYTTVAGTFGTPLTSLTVGDLDNDGDQDITAAGQQGITAWSNQLPPWVVGFNSGTIAGVNETWTSAVVASDFDKDGDPDLATGELDGRIVVRQNDGTPFDGEWITNEVGSVATGWQLLAMDAGDLDNDGDVDLASGYYYNHGPVIWENTDSPFLGTWSQQEIGSQRVGVLVLKDINGDGRLDIVTGGGRPWDDEPSNENWVTVWYAPTSPFSEPWQPINVALAYYAVLGLDVGDLDNDGDFDIVIGTYRAPPLGDAQNPVPPDQWVDVYQIKAFRNDGGNNWTEFDVGRDPEIETLTVTYHGFWGATVTDISLADLDGDGDLDIVATERHEGDFMVMGWKNDGTPFSGEHWSPSAIALGDQHFWLHDHVHWAKPGDFDRDGDVDVVAGSAQEEPYQVNVWENSGIAFGSFITETSWLRHYVGVLGEETQTGAVADFDQDGDLDLVASTYAETTNVIKLWENYVAPRLSLSILPENRVVAPGEIVSYTLTVTGLYGFDGFADLWVSGIPFGTIVSWSHDPILPPGQSILTLSVPQMSVPNTYSLLAVAVGEDAVGQVPFTLKVSRLNNRIFLPVVLMEH